MNKKIRGTLKQIAVLVIAFVLTAAAFRPAFAAAVKKKPILNADEITIVAGKSFNFDIMNKIKGSTYSWTVSNERVAAINENGVVTGTGRGTANIMCRISIGESRYLLRARVNVLKPAVKVNITNPVETLRVGEYYRLDADMIPGSANDIITWSSSDDSIARVDKDGSFAAGKAGTVTITASTLSERSDSVTIRIMDDSDTVETIDALEEAAYSSSDNRSVPTDIRIASFNASTDEKIYVRGVYTDFHKTEMATGTTRQINAYVEPETATVQKLKYRSLAPEIAKVSAAGLITALSPGKATITVTALDGSYKKDTIEIMVLDNLIITKELVDSDNEVIVLDKTYGNLTIDTSVGDADIYFGGVTVRNILAMDSGEYSLFMYDSTANEIRIFDVPAEIETYAAVEIETYAAAEEEKRSPSVIVGENTRINELNARISASIRQEDGSAIEGLRVTQDSDGRITVYLENYTGGLLLDASLGDMEIVATGCSLSGVSVEGSGNSGSIELSNGGASEINNLTLNGAANVNLGIPANEVNIDGNAEGASLTASESIGALNNHGASSAITISGTVDSIAADGENGNINIAFGASVGSISISGEGTSLSGEGEVSEAHVNADGCSIDTVNTTVNVGDVEGTRIQGRDTAGGSTVDTSETPQEEEKPASVIVTAIAVTGEDGATAIYTKGGTLQMMAAIEPANAENKEVTWSITDGIGLATISSTGLLTAAADGTVTVTATASDGSGIKGSLAINITGQEEAPEIKIPITAIGTISGTPKAGSALAAGALAPAEATVAYQWSISDTIDGTYVNIAGATESTYTPAPGDVGRYIKVTAAGTGDFIGSVTSTATGLVESSEDDFVFDSATKTITDYKGSGGVVAIPAAIGGITIEHIGENAFFDFDFDSYEITPNNITRLIVPNGIKTIKQYAFYQSEALTDVAFREQSELTTIDICAFCGCESLTGFEIPDSVSYIGNSAFSYCLALEDITLSDSIASIESDAFYGCTSLKEISISDLNDNYSCMDGVLYNKNKSLLITCPEGKQSSVFEIPDSVTSIGNYAFAQCTNISGITFKEPSKVTSIGQGAFNGCEGLESIILPDSVNDIESYAFYWCENLKSITIGANVSIGYDIIKMDNNFRDAYQAGGAGTYALKDDGDWERIVVPIPVTGVSISGIAKAGRTLSAAVAPSYATNIAYRWQANTGTEGAYADIAGATNQTFVIPMGLAGKTIRVVVSGDNGSTATSTATEEVEDSIFITAIGSIAGTAKPGAGLTAGALTPADATAVYQWSISDTIDGTYVIIAGATASTYTPVTGDIGKYIKVTASGTGDFSGSVTSTATGPVESSEDDFEFDSSTGTITGYSGLGGLVIIPGKIGGVTVEQLGEGAFYYNYSITGIRIPDSVTGIGSRTFRYCGGLTDIIIPDKVTSIGDFAFSECDALESITIPAGVNSIGYCAFHSCNKLQSINVSGQNSTYSCTDGVLYTKDMTELIAFPCGKQDTVFEIPAGVTMIEAYAFGDNENLTGIIIPNSMEEIGQTAFLNCTGIKSITIGPSVFVGSYILAYNSNFSDAYQAGGAGTYTADSYDGIWTKVIVPVPVAGVSITGTAKVGETLTAVVTPGNATNVTYQWQADTGAEGAYADIAGATASTYTPVAGDVGRYIKVTATGTGEYNGPVTSVAVGPVESSEGDFTFDSTTGTITGYTGSGGKVIIPATIDSATVEHIGENAFYGNRSITDIMLPDCVLSIKTFAFCGCDSLETVTFQANSNMVTIGNYAFASCIKLSYITIPEGVTTIGNAAFGECYSLTSITIPEGVSVINENALTNCVGLTSVIFEGTSELTAIGKCAFYECTSLTSIIVPGSVISIGDYAFGRNPNLQAIEVDESNTEYTSMDGVLYNSDKTILLCYPLGKANTSFEIPEGVVTIRDSAFDYCTKLTEVILPDSLTTIEYRALAHCANLSSLNIPHVTKLEEGALYGSSGLNSITLGTNVTIGLSLLSDNNNLRDVYAAEGAGTYEAASYDGIWTKEKKAVTGVSITGTAKVWKTLTAAVEPMDASSIMYEWQANTGIDGAYEDIAGATGRTFKIPQELLGKTLRVMVYGDYESTATSMVTQIVEEAEPLTAIGSVIGIPMVGVELKAGQLTPADADVTYAWSICDTANGTYVDIPGETADIYTPGAREVGKYIKVAASANSGGSLVTVVSDAAGPIASAEGSFEFDAATGAITAYRGSASLVCIPDKIGGVNVNQLTNLRDQLNLTKIIIPNSVTVIDNMALYGCFNLERIVIGANVIIGDNLIDYNNNFRDAYNAAGKAADTYTGTYNGAWYRLTAATGVSITGTAKAGVSLIAAVTPENATNVTYQWQANTGAGGSYENITGATDQTYIIPAWLAGKNIRVIVYGDYDSTVTSTATEAVQEPIPVTGIQAITGIPRAGEELYAGGLTPAAATVVYQWLISDTIDGTYVNIAGATAGTYTPVAGDAGRYIKLEATGTGEYNGSVTSVAVGPVESSEGDFDFDSTTGTITGYTGSGGSVIIPATIDGVEVEHIGENAFYSYMVITDIIIPDGVSSIGSQAFRNCDYLTDIIIPDGVESIGNNAFFSCNALEYISIPGTTTSIGSNVFGGCSSLLGIDVSEHNSVYSSASGALYTKDKTKLMVYPVGKTDTAFAIPVSVTNIEKYAFDGCESLADIIIPNNIIIGSSAFRGCTALLSITIDANVTIGSHLLCDNNYFRDAYEAGGAGTYTADSYDGVWTKLTAITSVSITGTVKAGQVLTAAVTPGNATNVTYQWQADTGSEGAYEAIAGATSDTFTIPGELVGKTIRVEVNGDYGSKAISASTAAVEAVWLEAIGTIIGAPEIGKVLIAGQVTPAKDAVTYQWIISDRADGTYSNIIGATSAEYYPAIQDVGKYIKVAATADMGGYSSTIVSAAAGPVVSSASDFMFDGMSGGVITGYTGSGGVVAIPERINSIIVTQIGASVFIYKTNITGVIIPGSIILHNNVFYGCTALTSITIGDNVSIGESLLWNNSYFRDAYIAGGAGTYVGTYDGTWIKEGASVPVAGVSITGTAKIGEILTAVVTPGNATNVTYRWQADTGAEGAYEDIAGAVSAALMVPAELIGRTLRVVVNGDNVSAATSAATACVAAADPIVTVSGAAITGIAKAGETLTAVTDPADATNVTYQWQAADTAGGEYVNIAEATVDTLILTSEHEGKYIRVVIGGDNGSCATSEATEAVTAADP